MSTMNMKRFKAKIDIQHILMMMLVFMLSFSIAIPISTITVHATEANGDGQSSGSVRDAPGKGYPSYCRTGWLVYIVHKSGAVASDVCYVNTKSSFVGLPAGMNINRDYLKTKIGGRTPNLPPMFNAPWGAPFTDGNKARGKEVVQAFRKNTHWVKDILGQAAHDNWKNNPNDYYLILEACAYHRVFTGSGTGQWILASGYGFGLAANAGFATRNGHTAWCDFEAIQNRARLEKQWPGLPAPVSGVAERSPAECVDITKGYSLLAIRSDDEVDRAEATFVLPEAAITRGVKMGQAGNATNRNNLTYIGVRDHNQSLVDSKMWGKKQKVKIKSCKAYCPGHNHIWHHPDGCVDVGHLPTCSEGCTINHGRTCPGHLCNPSCSSLDWDTRTITIGMNGRLTNTGSDPVVVTNKINSKWTSPSQCPKTYTDADYNWNVHTINPEYTHFISDMMIYRGGDKLTIAKWKNSSPDLLHNLGFACANQPQGTRYGNFGDDGDGCTQLPYTLKWSFTTTKRSTKFATAASCCHGTYGPCSKVAGAVLGSPKVAWFNGPQTHFVTIETYSGEPQQGPQYDVESGIPDTDWNGRETTMSNHMIKVGANKYVSDSIVSYNKNSIIFYPYIRMGYHTSAGQSANAGYTKVYVMGQYQREVKANDCAEIAYDQSASANMELSSTQWSTHQAVLANSRWSSWKDEVLPGGATYNVAIDSANTKEVHLRTYQIILIGDGKTQYLKTNNLSSSDLPDIYKKSAAITNHKRFAASVIKGYERTNMTQWFSPKEVTSSGSGWESDSKKYEDTLWYNTNSSGAHEVGNELSGHDNVTIHGGDNNGKQTSSDAKYYLNSDVSGFNQSASEGDLDVGIVKSDGSVAKITSDDFTGNDDSIPIMDKIWNNTKVEYYTFYTKPDAPGIFCMKVNGSGNKIADIDSSDGTYRAINDRTRLVTNMDNALEDGTGNSIAACYGAGWYNEAMDGITVMVCDTKLKVGYLSPAERSAVLDTLLTPKNTGGKKLAKLNNNDVSRDGLFGVAYYSQISTKNYSDAYGPNSHPNSANMVPYVWTPASISQESYRFSKMGEFHGQSVWVYDLRNMFYTKKFIIPNVTVQDLY